MTDILDEIEQNIDKLHQQIKTLNKNSEAIFEDLTSERRVTKAMAETLGNISKALGMNANDARTLETVKEMTAKLKAYETELLLYKKTGLPGRAIIPSTFRVWWAMIEAESEINGTVLKDEDVVLGHMGIGASCQVTVGDMRAMLNQL